MQLHSSSSKLKFVVTSPCFAILKNVVHSLEPGETPSDSASHLAPKLCTTFLKKANHYKTVAVRLQLIFQFTYVQYCNPLYDRNTFWHILEIDDLTWVVSWDQQFLNYCAYHVLVQPNFRRYYFYFLPDQSQILLDHFNALDEPWGEISSGFNNR